MPQVDFIFDFGSPNAYLAHKLVAGIERRTGVTFTYQPCLLGGIFKSTGNQAPMLAFADVKGKLEYDMIEFQRFIDRHELTDFNFNPNFPINTLPLMRGAVAMEKKGQAELRRYVDAILTFMWEAPRNLNDAEVLTQTWKDAGYNPDEMAALTQSPEVKKGLMENTAAAVERGVFGIPTFFVGDEMFFGKDRLDQVEEEIRKQST